MARAGVLGREYEYRPRFSKWLVIGLAMWGGGCARFGYDAVTDLMADGGGGASFPLPRPVSGEGGSNDGDAGSAGSGAGSAGGAGALPTPSQPTCSTACTNDHGTADCETGTCALICAIGYANCNGEPSDGCESDLSHDPAHCGSCPDACDGSTQICSAGACEQSPCAPGSGECDGDATLMCETELGSSLAHCGFCTNACSTANGTPACTDGTCGMQGCNVGFGDCDGLPANGCETPLATTAAHCGTCGNACPVTDGTPVCNASVCGTLCDLGGTFALKMSMAGSWPSNTVIFAGSGMFDFWLKAVMAHAGTSLDVSLLECGRSFPEFRARDVDETMLYIYPNGLFDAGFLPSSAATVTLSSNSPGASVAWPRTATQMGVNLANPATDSWPNSATAIPAGVRVDMDGDGKPGVTASFANGGPYVHPRTSTDPFAFNRADLFYLASRLAFSLDGTLGSCSASSGAATIDAIDIAIFGCNRASSAQDCNSTEGSFLDSNSPDSTPGSASYVLSRVADGAACPDVRAALP